MDILAALPPYTFSILIGLFFLVNLLLGLYKGRHVKTFKSYALADKSMGTGTLAITIIATIIGSKYVTAALVSAQVKGISGVVLASFIFPFFVLLFVYFVFPKLLSYRNCYTLGDVIGKIYGKEAQVFTGLFSVCSSVVLIAAQLLGVSHVAKRLGLNAYLVIFGLGITIILYTWIGGIRSVAFTDILQFVCIAVGFLFLAYRVLKLTDKEGVVIGSLQRLFFLVGENCKPKYLQFFGHKRFFNMVAGRSLLVLVLLSPPIINRILVAKNVTQMRRSFWGFTLFYPILGVIRTLIGFGLLIKHGEGKIKENIVFSKIAEYFFDNNPWAMVMLFIMLLAVVMSTADSFLNSTVTVVIRDLIRPFQSDEEEKKKQTFEPIKLIPYIAFIIGGLAIGMALLYQSERVNDLVKFAEVSASILLIPILFAVFRLKPSKSFFWSSIIIFSFVTGTLFYLGDKNILIIGDPAIWKKYILRRKTNVLIPIALAISFVLSLLAHYIIYGKFTFVPKETLKKKSDNLFLTFWETLKSPLTWATHKLSLEASAPVMIGLFLTLSWMLPELTAPQPDDRNLKVLLWVRIVGVFLCSGLLLHNRWKPPFKRYYPLFYYTALGYGFPFSYTLSFFYNPNNKVNTVLLIFALIVLMILVSQWTFLFLTLLGSSLAFVVAQLSPVQETFTHDTLWYAAVSIGYTLLISFFFIRFKEIALNRRLKNLRIWTLGYNHDMAPAHSALINFPRFIDNFLKKKRKKITQKGEPYYQLTLSEKEYHAEIQHFLDLLKSGGEMANALPKAFDQLVKEGHINPKQLKKTSLQEALKKGFLFLPKSYFTQVDMQINTSQDFTAHIHDTFFANIISNLVKNAIHHGKAKKIEIGCLSSTREVFIKDNGKGIPTHIEPYIFNLYFSTGSTGIGLPFIKQLIEEMEGKIRFETSPQGTTFFIFLPEK